MKKNRIIEKEEIEKTFCEPSLSLCKSGVEITEDSNKAVAILQIEKIVGQIIQSEEVLFSIGGQVGHLTFAYKIQNDSIFAELNNYCKIPNLIEDMALSFPTLVSRSYIILLIGKLRDIFARQKDMDVPDTHDEFVKRRIEMLNAIVETIRMEAV